MATKTVLIAKDKLAGVPHPKRYITEELVKAGIPAEFDDRDILIAKGTLRFKGTFDLYEWDSGDASK